MMRNVFIAGAIVAAMALPACRADAPLTAQPLPGPPPPPVPRHVSRVAVWYPVNHERDVAHGYARLEQAVLELKRQRPWVRVVDRRHLTAVTAEQRLQLSGPFADESAVHVGRLLGADSIVVFHIDGPSWRDRLLARMHGTMPPVVVSSKLVQVETGEVLYHDMVVAAPNPGRQSWDAYSSDFELQPLLQSTFEQSVTKAIVNLHEAFR